MAFINLCVLSLLCLVCDITVDAVFHRTELEVTRLSEVYRKRLHQGMSLYLEWEGHSPFSVHDHLNDSEYVDHALALFVQACFDRKEAFWLVKHAVLAFQVQYRFLKGKLNRSWDCLKSWICHTCKYNWCYYIK